MQVYHVEDSEDEVLLGTLVTSFYYNWEMIKLIWEAYMDQKKRSFDLINLHVGSKHDPGH